MRARIALLLLAIAAALAVVIVIAVRMLAQDREELLERFASDRAHQVDEARAEIESDLEAVSDDLRLTVRLAATTHSPTDLERELGALIAVAKYRAVEVRDPSGARLGRVALDLPPSPERDALDQALDRTNAAALADPGRVHSSPPVSLAGHWLRVFATAATAEPRVVAALVVDSEPLFARLRIVAADPGARLVILGEHGVAAPATDPAVLAAIELVTTGQTRAPAFSDLLARLRRRESGKLRIPAGETARLGLGRDALVAIYRPIRVAGGEAWSTALLASTESVAAHDRAIFRRMVAVVALIAMLLATLSIFVILTTRRTIALRERLRRAAEVAHLHEKADKVLDTIPTGVIVLAESGEITSLNAVLRGRLGADAVGSPIRTALSRAEPAIVEQLETLVAAAAGSGTTRSMFAESCRLFGDEGSYNLHAVPLERRFPDARVLVVIEDLSMTGQLERQLLRSEKLATVGVLAAGIAHEIGTPLGVARGRAEYTRSKLDNPALADGQRIIIEQIDQVSRTIRRLLDFARIMPTEVLGRVDVAAAARGVAELLRLEAERRHLTLEIEVAADLPGLAADPDQLEQVLVNLVMNAFDASPPESTVRVTAAARSDADRVRFTVTDEGRGIPADQRAHVFDPFFTTKKRGKGTGLGLSIVAQIVRNHGGTVELDSEEGRGTRVAVLWPAAGTTPARRTDGQ